MTDIRIWGFPASTYVRAVRMLLAEKGVTDYEQVPVDVLAGEGRTPEHLERHPFGKIPVVDIDGFRIIETTAISRYLDATLPGKKLVPNDPKRAARMDMVTSIVDIYAYASINFGVLAYYLFPDFVGGKDEAKLRQGLADGKKVFVELMKIKGDDPWLAGPEISVADLYLAPIVSYIGLTPHKDEFLAIAGVDDWWTRVSGRESFKATAPS